MGGFFVFQIIQILLLYLADLKNSMILLFDLSTWWSGLSNFESIYWLIAIPFTVMFNLIMLMTFFGGDVDSDSPDADMDIDSDGGIDFQFFTLKT